MTTQFKDNFSKQSEIYFKYRPTYPAALFQYLSSLTQDHSLAWDCGTGNGQSAISLTLYYKAVYATDPSEQQIKNALPNPKITYKVEKAEQPGLDGDMVDLITIAQAIHWFDFEKFYSEAKRVLKKEGIIAAWAYGLPSIASEIDGVLQHFHDEIIGEFWQYENRLIDKEYSTIPFPFKQVSPPQFKICKSLSLDDLLGLVSSWSAVQRFIDKNGYDPVEELENDLLKLWGNKAQNKEVNWKLILKIGQNTKC
jgi:ubiquinone/menaquinone biosynthesis C-methylase UbiE